MSDRQHALRTWPCLFLATLLAAASALAASTDDVYSLGPDSMAQDGVPKGKVIGPLTLASQVFTNTTRHYWIYVPAQYDSKTPADLMIFQDGQAFVGLNGEYRIPCVFDNLIYRREMPVTIGVFINPGHSPDQPESSPTNWGDSINNRAAEYNELNDHYAKLIVNELLPALERITTFPKIPMIARLRAQVRGRSALSRSHGSARTNSTKSSAPSAALPTFAGDTFIPTSFAKPSASLFASTFRMASTTCGAVAEPTANTIPNAIGTPKT